MAEFRRRLTSRFGGDLVDVRLFGSWARGEATEESDVDVLVLLRDPAWSDRRAVLDLAGDLFYELDLLVSPTVLSSATYQAWRRQERPLVMDIERDGIPA